MRISWQLPLKTVSESNSSEHWAISRKRHINQKFFIRSLFHRKDFEISFPCVVTLTRLSPRKLDCEENLPMAFKWIKDEIGACLFPEKVIAYKTKRGKIVINSGHADSDPRVSWVYRQEKNKIFGVKIEIESSGD